MPPLSRATPDAPASPREPPGGPVTVVVTRRVRPGREADYEAWLERLLAGVASLPGYLGTDVIRPPPDGPRTYTAVYRFDSVAHLQSFEASELRRRALVEVAGLVESDAVWRRLTGLELWFTPPAGTVVPQPSRFRMALVMIAVVYGLVLVLGRLAGALLPEVPFEGRLFATVVVEVFLMTYVVMPRVTRALARWIYPAG